MIPTVKCNFASIFAKIEVIDDLKAVANSICAQVKEAFDVRKAEIEALAGNTITIEAELVVEDSPESKPATTETTPKAKGKKGSKAKEIAAQLKAKAESEPKSESASTKAKTDEVDLIDITDTKALKALNLTFEKYTDRCWVLRGDTRPIRKILHDEFNGLFKPNLKGQSGWIIRNKDVERCADMFGLKVKIA